MYGWSVVYVEVCDVGLWLEDGQRNGEHRIPPWQRGSWGINKCCWPSENTGRKLQKKDRNKGTFPEVKIYVILFGEHVQVKKVMNTIVQLL